MSPRYRDPATQPAPPVRDGEVLPCNDPRIPPAIRLAAARLAQAGDALYFSNTPQGGEWWLIDGRGELIEAFWQEKR